MSSRAISDQVRNSVSVCLLKNSGVVVLVVISQAVAFAPFSQNSNGWGEAGFAQEQLTHAKPSVLFCFNKISLPKMATSSCVRMAPTAFTEPQPPAGPE